MNIIHIMKKQSFLFGRLSKTKKSKQKYGSIGVLFSKWGELKLSSFYIEFTKEASYSGWGDANSENLCIVKSGSAKLVFGNKEFSINKNFVFKVYPNQKPVIKPNKKLVIVSVQMPTTMQRFKGKVDLKKPSVIDTTKVPSKVYEFETLGQEVYTPEYKPGLGLIKFAFVNPIPIHKHPFSGRIILPISGKGVTYAEPNLYEAHSDTFVLFEKGITHTNGPVAGHRLDLYAVQLPWIKSGIDSKNIAGSQKFVKYVGVTLPRKLWKKKNDIELLLKKLENV